jgi:hypothetical protein
MGMSFRLSKGKRLVEGVLGQVSEGNIGILE